MSPVVPPGLEVVEKLMSREDIDVNLYNGEALSSASKMGSVEVVEKLLSREDIDVNWYWDYKQGWPKQNALLETADKIRGSGASNRKALVEVFSLLLKRKNIDVNSQDYHNVFCIS